jgi:hypothetical protein
VPFKEITSACHCAIVIPTERSDEGSLFHYNRKYFVTHTFLLLSRCLLSAQPVQTNRAEEITEGES